MRLIILIYFSLLLGPTLTRGNEEYKNFDFVQANKHVKVWFYQSSTAKPESHVLIVMHGVGRNGEDYLKDWIPYAQKNNLLLIVPEFSRLQFPKDAGYNYGNTVDLKGNPVPENEWSFNMIEPVFDAVLKVTGNKSLKYSLYGHSAGAQFVQRFIYFVPQARLNRVVAANAGWYMLPDLNKAFPYGLKYTKVTESDFKKAIDLDFTILLGTADIDPHHAALRHTPEADEQGSFRLARGKYFFAKAQESASALNIPLKWKIAYAPGIGHTDKGMATFAEAILFSER